MREKWKERQSRERGKYERKVERETVKTRGNNGTKRCGNMERSGRREGMRE